MSLQAQVELVPRHCDDGAYTTGHIFRRPELFDEIGLALGRRLERRGADNTGREVLERWHGAEDTFGRSSGSDNPRAEEVLVR